MQILYGGYLWDYLKKLFSRFSLISEKFCNFFACPASMHTFHLTENPFGLIFHCFSQRGHSGFLGTGNTASPPARIANPHRQCYGY
jgi:hypothetical protein